MRGLLRVLAVLLMGGSALWWVQAGRNPGWTKDQVAVEKLDEITGIGYVEYEKRVVPGVDLLGVAWAAALVLGGASCWFGRKRSGASV